MIRLHPHPVFSKTDNANLVPDYDPSSPRKLIFASGGIGNGSQAQEALDAGAAVAMMYTATVYGGVGTITRVKRELKESKKI
jgi:dihydroorotate dehydrogenase